MVNQNYIKPLNILSCFKEIVAITLSAISLQIYHNLLVQTLQTVKADRVSHNFHGMSIKKIKSKRQTKLHKFSENKTSHKVAQLLCRAPQDMLLSQSEHV